MDKTAAIHVEQVSFTYNGPQILENVNFVAQNKAFVGLVGPNGGGKSTLLKLILGLLKPDKGHIKIHGLPPEKGCLQIGYVPQFALFPRDYPVSVEEVVLMGRLGQTRFWGGYREQDKQIAMQVMQEAQIENLKQRPINSLSGGQLQRVLIARALACEPKTLILDEPTANIDMRTEEDIFELLKTLNQRLTLLVVSHDIGFISGYVDQIACLNQTLLCHHTDALEGGLDAQSIENLYGGAVRAIHHQHPGMPHHCPTPTNSH